MSDLLVFLSHDLGFVQVILEVVDNFFELFGLEVDLWNFGDF